MSGAPTFDTEKKQKWGEFITPPRPTGKRSNKQLSMFMGIVQNMDWTGLDNWTGQLDWTVGLDNWTGQLDWTIGLDFEWDFFH